jgi:hypothetical protein
MSTFKRAPARKRLAVRHSSSSAASRLSRITCGTPERAPLVDALLQDVRYGARLLRRSPLLSLTAGLTLALCIAANAALFTVVHNVLLRPLGIPESDRVVRIYNSCGAAACSSFSSEA